MQDLDWDSLRFVLALTRQASLDRAARVLGVDPSTVSRTVRALEVGLGLRIFDRTGSGHRSTAAGQQVVEAAEQVESRILAMQRQADRADERLAGPIRIAAAGIVCRHLAPHLARFGRRHPEVSFVVFRGSTAAAVLGHDADLAVRFERPHQLQLASRRVTTLGFGLYAAPGYLAEHPFLVDQPLRGHRLLGYLDRPDLRESRWLAERADGACYALRTSGVDPLQAAAASGLGLAVLPCCLADADPRLVRLMGPEKVFTRDVWLVVHRDARRVARIRAFMTFLAEELREQAAEFQGLLRQAG